MIHPTITFTSGRNFPVKGIDASRTHALAADFASADSPERAIFVVKRAVELGVALWTGDKWTVVLGEVESIDCHPFD